MMDRPFDGKQIAQKRLDEMAGQAADPPWEWNVWRFRFDVRDIVTPAEAGAQTFDLTTAVDVTTGKPFPANVWMEHAHAYLVEDFSGGAVSAATILFGDTNDPNGLITISSVFTGVGAGFLRTVAATEYDLRPEDAFVPLLTVATTTDDVDGLDEGIVDLYIPYSLRHPATV